MKSDSVTSSVTSSSDSAAAMPGRGSSSRKKKLRQAQASRNSSDESQPYSVHSMTPSAAIWMAAIAPMAI